MHGDIPCGVRARESISGCALATYDVLHLVSPAQGHKFLNLNPFYVLEIKARFGCALASCPPRLRFPPSSRFYVLLYVSVWSRADVHDVIMAKLPNMESSLQVLTLWRDVYSLSILSRNSRRATRR